MFFVPVSVGNHDWTARDNRARPSCTTGAVDRRLGTIAVRMSIADRPAPAHYLAAIVEWSDAAIISTDLKGVITSWNRAAERLFGYSAADAIGTSLRIVVPHDRQPDEEEVRARIGRGETVEQSTLRRRSDGSLIPVSLIVSPIRDQRGEIIGASRIARDVSSQQTIEADLAAALARQAELQQRLLSLVAASRTALVSPRVDDVLPALLAIARQIVTADGYAVWRFDRDGAVWRIGASHGISPEFAAGVIQSFENRPVSTVPFAAPLMVDDVHSQPLLAERLALYTSEGIASMIVVPLLIGDRASGSIVFYYRTPRRFTDVETQVAIALGNLASATLTTAELYDAQRRSRAQSEFLAEAGALLAGSLDYQETLKKVAELAVPQIADWCAVDLCEDGEHVERLAVAHVDPAKREMAREFRQRFPEDPRSPYGVAHVARTGTPLLVQQISPDMLVGVADAHRAAVQALNIRSFICVPLTAHGRTFGALTFVAGDSGRRYRESDLPFAKDVAFRAALAVDNARAYDEAQRANRLKDDFLATLSHELRTPLNAIVGYSRMLRAGMVADERKGRAYEIVDRNATALTQIVEDVLDVSRIVSGKIRLHVQPIDLAALAASSIDTVQPAADVKGVRIERRVEPHLPSVVGDPDRLQQVVWNLLSNAVKFTPRGGRILVSIERLDAEVALTVSDTGIGIDPAFLPHMFERFRQADSRFAREFGGLGLGLAIARQLAELHGGTLTAHSAGRGTGATFRLQLPVKALEDQWRASELTPRDLAPPPPLEVSLRGVTVLAVDDDEDALTLLREVLESAGATVLTARSAAEALRLLEGEPPQAILSDIGMPSIDGFQFIERVRQLPSASATPAAALTAYARSEDRTRALRSGFQTYLAKPIDPRELVSAVLALTRHPVQPR
jgi:PAS domain S-box-containing protein